MLSLMNLSEYHRPQTVEEAIELLQRKAPKTVVLGGGTWLNGEGALGNLREVQAVVDIADLGLNKIEIQPATDMMREPTLVIGAAVSLQALVEHESTGVRSTQPLHVIGESAQAMAGLNIRNRATIAGAVATADSSSPLVAALLACDAELVTKVGDKTKVLPLPGFLGYHDQVLAEGALITEVRVPMPYVAQAYYHAVARTPRDYPAVCVVLRAARRNSGPSAARVAVGGIASFPIRLNAVEFAIDTKPEIDFVEAELHKALAPITPPNDYLGSAEYRKEMAAVLVRRAVRQVLA